MSLLLEHILKEYPFTVEENKSFYVSGYVDKK
jgi:hypothetical protein